MLASIQIQAKVPDGKTDTDVRRLLEAGGIEVYNLLITPTATGKRDKCTGHIAETSAR